MSLILSIDTAINTAYISIGKNGETLEVAMNTEQKDHGGFLQPAIKKMLKNLSISIHELDAVAISVGPGSYTGLRVGMASAKGFCFALKKPLIAVGTLEILAFSAVLENSPEIISDTFLLCPMIDARRMEVFTALYNRELEIIMDPCALILDENSFANTLLKNQILFFGNGAKKWEGICRHQNAKFSTVLSNPLAINILAHKKFKNNDFADLAYIEPLYIKEFFGGPAPNKYT